MLVHSNIWDLIRVCSSLGIYYFVTFIDNFSSCTKVFLLENQSNVFSVIQNFSHEIQNQFGTTIKFLQTDNAHEYMSSQFQSFLTS